MLASDCEQFLRFVQERDPVVPIPWDSNSLEIKEIPHPCTDSGTYCLWNQAVLPFLERKQVVRAGQEPYYRVDSALPVIEFSSPGTSPDFWNNKPALLQGRIWGGFETANIEFEGWYEALVRWVRRHFLKNPIPLLGGFIGPAAFEWFRGGGLLLPMLRPPVTSEWLAWATAQDAHRKMFSQ